VVTGFSAQSQFPALHRRRLPRLGAENLLGLSDQILISLSNFATMIVVARALPPRGFGVFSLAYAALIFANNLQGALLTQPHNVLGAALSGSEYRRYTTGTAVAQLVFTAALASVCTCAYVTGHLLNLSGAGILLPLALALVAWQLQEFTRRVLYTERRLAAAVFNDAVSYGAQAVALIVLWRIGRMTAQNAITVVAATCLIASIIGYIQTRTSFQRTFNPGSIRANWNTGKWLGAATIGSYASTQLYVYLAAAMIGAGAVGILTAAETLLRPVGVLLNFLETALPTRLAHVAHGAGPDELHDQITTLTTRIGVLCGAYCVAVAVVADPAMRFAYGPQYAGFPWVVRLLAAYYFVSAFVRLASVALRVVRATRSIFVAQAYASVISLAGGWTLIALGGVAGAAAGMVIAGLVLNWVLWAAYVKEARQSRVRLAGNDLGGV
jgi:O-antigen/teichoic acid export membrane protein